MTPLGYGRIELQVEDVGIGPFSVSVDEASIARSSSKVELELHGQVNGLGSILDVDGSVEVDEDGLSGSFEIDGGSPNLLGWALSGALVIRVDPSDPAHFFFVGEIDPPRVDPVSVTGTIERYGDFSLSVTTPEISFPIGSTSLTVGGSVSIFKTGNAIQLRILNGTAGVGFLGDIAVGELRVNSNGTFKVENLNVSRFGDDRLALVLSRLDLERKSNGDLTAVLQGGSITGTFLNGRSIPAFSNGGTSVTFSTNMAFAGTVSAGSLNLGPALSTGEIGFNVELDNGGLDIEQSGTASVTALAGSANMKIKNFDLHIGTNGGATLDGQVTGKLSVLGRQISQGSFTISNPGGALMMTLSADETIDMGDLGSFDVDGWFRSDGRFDFDAAFDGEYGVSDPLGILQHLKITVDGEIALAVGPDGAKTSLVGTGCGPFPTNQYPFLKMRCGTAEARLASNNVLTGGITFGDQSIPFSFPPGVQPSKATSGSAPNFGDVPDLVLASVAFDAPEFAPIHYLELFDLDATGEDSIACSPPSGGLFEVDATTAVFCTAVNEFGADMVTFDVQVARQIQLLVGIAVTVPPSKGGGTKPPPRNTGGEAVLDQGGQVTFTGTADPGSTGKAVAHSVPTELGTFTADANGDWALTVTIPASLEIGEHTIVIDTVVDGVRTLVQMPVEVVAAATEPDPGIDLPATGGNARRTPTIALWILLAGLLLFAATKRRRTPDVRSSSE